MEKRTKLQMLHDIIADHLVQLEDLFADPEEYRLTFIARNVNNPEAHVIVSSEEPGRRGDRVREALAELEVGGKEVPTFDEYQQGGSVE